MWWNITPESSWFLGSVELPSARNTLLLRKVGNEATECSNPALQTPSFLSWGLVCSPTALCVGSCIRRNKGGFGSEPHLPAHPHPEAWCSSLVPRSYLCSPRLLLQMGPLFLVGGGGLLVVRARDSAVRNTYWDG